MGGALSPIQSSHLGRCWKELLGLAEAYESLIHEKAEIIAARSPARPTRPPCLMPERAGTQHPQKSWIKVSPDI